jgi:predicted Rossmann fold flavoprotein
VIKERYDLIVIGGGPAGIMAAGQAASRKRKVLLLEKMEKPLRKLRITGKGRCNISNAQAWEDFSKHVFPNHRFFKPAFYNFSNTDLTLFLEQIGLSTVVERGNRIYPLSQDAFEVAEALTKWAKAQGVTMMNHAEAINFQQENTLITAVEVRHRSNTALYAAKAFIVATGGLSYPATGSTGDGYRLAQATGHSVTPLHPSLTGIHLHKHALSLKGLALRNVALELWIDGGKKDMEFGEINFNETGMEGPVVLRFSRAAIAAFEQGKKVSFVLNLKPAIPVEELQQRFFTDVETSADSTVAALLRKYMPAALIAGFTAAGGFPQQRKVSELSISCLNKLLLQLQSWPMQMFGYQGYERAVITAGGVSFDDIDPKTMCSRRIPNLYFAGEVLDLDADTGGYNLQIAFSTGFLAGNSCCNNG